MYEIRILIRVHAAGAEVDLAVGDIHAVHAAHDPVALRDLILHATGLSVVQVEMVPPVAFRRPDQLTAGVCRATTATLRQLTVRVDVIGEVVPAVAVHEEALGDFIDHRAHGASRRVDLEHAVDHVTALIVLERVRGAVLPPYRARDCIRIRK